MISENTVEWWFDLNGAALRIAATDAALLAPLHTYLGELIARPVPDTAHFHVTIARGAPEHPRGGARLLYDGRLPEGTPCRLSSDGRTRWLVVADRLSVAYSTSERRAHMQVLPGAEALIGGTSGIILLDAALLVSQQVLIHAAALRLPERQSALLLLAPSGTGKTTTSLALALQGFALMTDDTAVVTSCGAPSDVEPRVWGLPRPLKVHRRTVELLPPIGQLLGDAWSAEDEHGISRAALHAAIEVLPPCPVPLAALIVLGPRTAGAHRLRPMAKADLLALVAGDNIFCSRLGVQTEDLDRFHAIARTVARMPALELNVGSPLDSLSECILAVLG